MAPHGTSKAYIVDRLKREGELALLDAVMAGKITALTAAVSLGWVKRPPLMGGSTHRAHRRDFQLRAIADGGSILSQMQELWLGPNPSQGSLFGSREELKSAWEKNRAEVMRLWGSHGRRPMGWWEFEAGDLKHPGYDRERSVLWRSNLLTAEERAELEAEWKREFDAVRGKDARKRREHYAWADIPHELVKVWSAARARRNGRQPAAPSEEAAAAK